MSKTIVITGGTSGIGFHTAVGLAKTGAQLVVTGRSKERGQDGVRKIKEASGNDDVHLALGDLSEQAGVRQLAEDLLARFNKIDVLINNAGMLTNEMTRTPDGFEMDFAVNVVAPYTLTRLLAPALSAAKPARVINVTGGPTTSKLDADNLQAEKGFVGMSAYVNSKRAMEAMSLALAEEMEPQGVFVNVVYPGAAATSMTKNVKVSSMPWFLRPVYPLFRLFMRDDGGKGAQKAARSSVWGANAPETAAESGQYFDTNSKRTRFHASIYEPQNQQAVLRTISDTLGA